MVKFGFVLCGNLLYIISHLFAFTSQNLSAFLFGAKVLAPRFGSNGVTVFQLICSLFACFGDKVSKMKNLYLNHKHL